jgi:endonuclease/exonuclease/phosphatase family metal-dependent hydrolase
VALSAFLLSVLLLAVVTTAQGQQPEESSPEFELKIMTFNVLVNFSNPPGIDPWNERRSVCVDLIRESKATLVGLQEPSPLQAKFFAEQFPGMEMVHHPKYTDAALMYDKETFKELDRGHWWLSPTPEKPSTGFGNVLPRIVVWVKLQHRASQRELYFFDTHFDNSRPSQSKMAALCEEQMKPFEETGLPMVFVGDFNTNQDRGDYARLTRGDWKDSYLASPLASESGKDDRVTTRIDGQTRIDHIFYRGAGVRAIEWNRVEPPTQGKPYSDHYAVRAVLTVDKLPADKADARP